MNSSFLLPLGIKFYESGEIQNAIKYFLKAIEIDSNLLALKYLCNHCVKFNEKSLDIISIVSENLKYLSISSKLDLLNILHPKYPVKTHLIYKNLLLLKLAPNIKYYILEILCRKPFPSNTELNARLQFLKKMLDIKITDSVICKYILTRQYITTTDPLTPPGIDLDHHFETNKMYTKPKIVSKRNKIYIGFITANLDKTGMTTFTYDIINSLDTEKFSVFVYYDDSEESMLLQTNKTNNDVSWVPIHNKHNNVVYHQIHNIHKIDILVDFMVFRSPNRIRLLTLCPAKIQINYTPINIPLKCYTHTLTDKYTNQSQHHTIQFKGVKQLFNLGIPPVDRNFQMNGLVTDWTRTVIGIVNSQMQISLKCVLLYNAISTKYNITYIVKGNYIPNLKNASYITDTTDTLTDYFKLFNTFDYVIDTFPYSGNNTTAAALYMGCPVLSFYNPDAIQNSNTSSAMNLNCGQDKYVFNSTRAILKFKFKQFRDNYNRKLIHKAFLASMNKKKFIKEFEEMLTNLT
jgi:hypothetical protein